MYYLGWDEYLICVWVLGGIGFLRLGDVENSDVENQYVSE